MGEQENDEVFGYNGEIEGLKSNVIEKGRYRFKVTDIYKKISDAGNNLVIVSFEIWDIGKTQIMGRIKRSLMTDKEQKMSFLWHNFLFSIGIRSKGAINIPKDKIIGAEGLIDLGIEKNNQDTSLDQNKILNFSPILQPTAPISDVPAETMPEKPAEEKPKAEKQKAKIDEKAREEKEEDSVENL